MSCEALAFEKCLSLPPPLPGSDPKRATGPATSSTGGHWEALGVTGAQQGGRAWLLPHSQRRPPHRCEGAVPPDRSAGWCVNYGKDLITLLMNNNGY